MPTKPTGAGLKNWATGPRGGRYYVSAAGEKIYGAEAAVRAAQDGVAKPHPGRLEPSPNQPGPGSYRRPGPTEHGGSLGKHPAGAEGVFKPTSPLQDRLPPGKTAREHADIAREFLGRHNAGFAEAKAKLTSLAPPDAKIEARVKELSSTMEKLDRARNSDGSHYYKDATGLMDATGMRAVVKNIDEVKATADKIRANYKVIEESDYISKPKGDYRSHHLIVEDHGVAKEIQVRTPGQDAFANWAHDAYKPQNELQKSTLKDPQSKAVIDHYSHAMSEHIYAKDQGKQSIKPECPQAVRVVFGCVKI
jgi:ppGpp synthetase/RelA/SpoT-type nucleotidyltranferase